MEVNELKEKNLYDLFDSLEKYYNENPVIKYRRGDGDWKGIYPDELKKTVYKIAMGLDSLGLSKGDKVCLMNQTNHYWTLIDFAIEIMGMVNVPIYPTLTGEQINYIVNHSEGKVFFIQNNELYSKFSHTDEEFNNVKKLIFIESDYPPSNENNIMTLNKLISLGEENLKQKGIEYIKERGKSIDSNELASILYTSGTTGEPKGVMLSHLNFISNAYGAYEKLELPKYNNTIVFLPLSHAFARTCNYGLMMGGTTLWYAESLETLGRDMTEAKPEVMIVVPRVFEKVYERVLDNINNSGGIKKILFYWAKKIGEEVARKKDNKQPISGYLNFKYNIADKLVFSKIREKTGGRLFFAVSGSSPLAKHISYFFYGIGLPVLEGYGLTEASPIVSSNTIHKDKIGTVGTTFKWVEVKTADDGELYVKGPNIMMGYYKNEDATKETINDEGWLKTDDIAEINKEGFIKIIDRKKDMFKTSGGKYIVPQKIENMAKINQFIAEFVVIAENMRYVSALLLPNFDKLKDYAKEENITFSNNNNLISNEKIKNLYQNIIDQEINPHLARYETIKKFVLIEKPFTIENNELTPSLKVKRRVVNQHYKDLINRLYEE